MSELLAQFEGYRLHTVGEHDRDLVETWINADAAHRGILEPDFFLGLLRNSQGDIFPDERATVMVLSDRRRELMYIRLERASRVYIQFPPEPTTHRSQEQHRHRMVMANALMKGMGFLEVGLRKAGATEWIFDSQSSALRTLAVKRMGFQPSPHELRRPILPGGDLPAILKSGRIGPQILKEGA